MSAIRKIRNPGFKSPLFHVITTSGIRAPNTVRPLILKNASEEMCGQKFLSEQSSKKKVIFYRVFSFPEERKVKKDK